MDREFWQFSDQLRLQNNLSIGDSIWSNNSSNNLLLPPAAARDNNNKLAFGFPKNDADRYNAFPTSSSKNYSNPKNDLGFINSNNANDVKSYFNKSIGRPASNSNQVSYTAAGEKKKSVVGDKKKNSSSSVSSDKQRFKKSLPASESLPRGEAVGGYIFVCNNDTMEENLKRQLFGLPSRYRDSVRAIRPGLPLFLYNYSTHQLHGIFEAASFGGSNIDPTAWEDNKCTSESRFPAQVLFFPLDEIEVLLFLDKKIELGTRERSLDEVIDCQSRWLNWLADVTIKQ
jgi:hypothetical protein